MLLQENDFFDLYVVDELNVYLRLKKGGFPIKSFDRIIQQHPRIKIQSFPILKKALTEVDKEHLIGTYTPLLEIDVQPDRMKAHLYLNVTMEDFGNNRESLLQKAEQEMDELGICFGREPLDSLVFIPGSPLPIAIGKEPVQGEDAVITYMKRPVRKPVIREDGSADYYEMNFVTHINQGDWLGEKILPQEGTPGMDIFGNAIPAPRGSDAKLEYDSKSIFEVEEENRIVLRASHSGALEFNHGVISVGAELVINGDVGPETGSITFDGAVRILGTVLAGYSVNATGDISIEGREGVTNSKEICSSEGDLYIKGGVFGGGMSVIEAKGDIFLKHANNCKIFASTVHVGLYMLGCEVIADRVHVDKNRGKIIGGHVEAMYTIECAYAGNQHERTTHLHAKGVDKDLIYKEIQHLAQELKEIQETTRQLEEHTGKFQTKGDLLGGQQAEALQKMQQSMEAGHGRMLELDAEIQLGMRKIKNALPPKIEVAKEAYPGVVIHIGQKSTTLTKTTKGVFEVFDNVLNV
ncbi:DUF342 domain-containing protein [Sporosarcina sp. Te-1]|uniref:DUF342 domain-containing protein n=1 Tax=Sporosarcina sp. Te-1 TaxID=2818390 RepID=UPI001A9D66D5|nr:FapA family protein [Sporosarcina sp. Te-1]QTD41736.1 DUF342 domain-containing protein [Sporosarcina sp. Te-1]